VASTKLDGEIEAHAEARGADVASVRELPADGPAILSSVGVMSSDTPLAGDGMFEQLTAIRETVRGEGDGGSDNEEVSGGAAPSGSFQVKKVPCPLSINRSSDPCNEFENNGMHIVEMFRARTYPLRRFARSPGHEVSGAAADPGAQKLWFPLPANGSLSMVQTRHLLLQFTNVAAHDIAQIFVLANQLRRHSMLRAVGGRVTQENFECFVELVNDTTFDSKLENAINHPETKDAKQFMRKVLPLLSFIGQAKPWGRSRRSAVVRKLLGMYERYGPPSVFWTVSVDDVHNILSIRMSFPSSSNAGFPSFAAGDELKTWEEGGTAQEVKVMLKALRHGEAFTANGVPGSFGEGRLQRLAVENPVATAMSYQRVIESVVGILIGLPVEKHRKITDPMLDCVEGPGAKTNRTARTSGKRRPGIFGVPLCTGYVTEESQRKALHCHACTTTAASPAFLAKLAARNSPEWEELKAALETQVSAEVDYEACLVHRALGVLKVPAPRPSFASRPSEETPSSETRVNEPMVALAAISLGDHKHHETCHKGNSGQHGCRGGYERGHPVEETHVVQIVSSATAEASGFELAGNQGAPVACDSCKSHWGTNKEEAPLVLVEPKEVCVQAQEPDARSPVSFKLALETASS
jgi:hypothetical protein